MDKNYSLKKEKKEITLPTGVPKLHFFKDTVQFIQYLNSIHKICVHFLNKSLSLGCTKIFPLIFLFSLALMKLFYFLRQKLFKY